MIVAIVNQKGGVGKTTTCMNLAASFAAIGKKILVVDFDPQGNASTGIGVDNRKFNIYGALIGKYPIDKAIAKTKINNLSIVPATVNLAAGELELKDFEKREYILKNLLKDVKEEYDFVFMDCPPSLGLLTINALVAAEELIIPMQCEFFALEGLSHLLKTIKIIKKHLNPSLEIKGVLLTMYDRRNRISEQVAREVKKHLADKLFATVIPRNVKVSEAPSFGMPVIAYDYHSKGAQAYIRLVKEILGKD